MAKTLVIYFSRSGENYVDGKIKNLSKGNTEIVAEYIQECVDVDLFKVETEKEYSNNYMECIEDAKQEIQQDSRPKLKKYLSDISEYDNIVVAGPCWWGTYPMSIFSELEGLDFRGKNVFSIMTHEGSGFGSSKQSLMIFCKGGNVMDGLAIHGAEVQESKKMIQKWAEENLK